MYWPFKVRDTAVGKGLFATDHLYDSNEVGIVAGKVISDPDYDSTYAIDLGEFGVLEPFAPFRFVNHGCTPNCELLVEDMTDRNPNLPPQIWLYAIKDISPGEELTIDYGWPATSAIRCGCNSIKCRGWVVDASQLDQVLNSDRHPDLLLNP